MKTCKKHFKNSQRYRMIAPCRMPGVFYTSQEYYEHETRTVLPATGIALDVKMKIPNTGDYFTAQLLNESLVVRLLQIDNVRDA